MSELNTSTLKYFHLAISEFLPKLKELKDATRDKEVKEEIENLVEAYEDIDTKIGVHGLNYDDPNRAYEGEPFKVEIAIPDGMVQNLARLSHRLLFAWKERLEKLKKKTYLTDANQEETYRLKNLIWPLEALLKAESYVLGKNAHLGPLVFPGESAKGGNIMIGKLLLLQQEIQQCYSLGDSELLERKKLADTETRVRAELSEITTELADEIFKLKFKKLDSGLKTVLKSGFHNRKTAESKLTAWEGLIWEIVRRIQPTADRMKTVRHNFKTDDIFIESRSQGEDQHILIGKRDGTPDKAHSIIDAKTGLIRVEENQQDPTELVPKIESIITLPGGKRIKTTRESMVELPSLDNRRPRIDLASNFTVSGGAEGNFLSFEVKNDGVEAALDVQYEFLADDLKAGAKIYLTHNLSPGQSSSPITFRYTETDLFRRQLTNPRIVFSYRSADGRSFMSGRKLIQDSRADGNYNIHSRPGNYLSS